MRTPGFRLNHHNRKENVLFESHDPSMMYDPVSGYCYSYATDSAITSEYRMHYMVVRRMYFVDGWPVFSPEPFAEEETAMIVTERQKAAWKEQGVEWESIEFSNSDNHMVKSRFGTFPDEFASGITGAAYDFENSRVCTIVAGYTKSGNTIWMKQRKEQKHG